MNRPAVNGVSANGVRVNGAVRHGTPLCGGPEEGAGPNGLPPNGTPDRDRADTGADDRGADDRPAPSPLRRIADFPQPVRFLAIAVTATLWDARVAFVTLVVGCVVAVTAQLADPARSRQ